MKQGQVSKVSFRVVESIPHSSGPREWVSIGSRIELDLSSTVAPEAIELLQQQFFDGCRKQYRQTEPDDLRIDLADSSVTVVFPDGEKCCQVADFVDEDGNGREHSRVPWCPLPLLPGATVHFVRECAKCEIVLVSAQVCGPDTNSCAVCAKEEMDKEIEEQEAIGRRERWDAAQASRDTVCDPIPATPELPHMSDKDALFRAWQRRPEHEVAKAMKVALQEFHLRCPYEAHDRRRVLEWLRDHPVHRFDLANFIRRVVELLGP